MNMSNTRWLYVARRQWGEVSKLTTAENDPERGKKDEKVEA